MRLKYLLIYVKNVLKIQYYNKTCSLIGKKELNMQNMQNKNDCLILFYSDMKQISILLGYTHILNDY